MKEGISVENLSYSISGKTILNSINLTISLQEAIAIVGKSGSGKTTLGKIIAGQLPASSGSLLFNLPTQYKRIFISQQHDFREHAQRSYYQQRFDSNYGDTDSPLAINELAKTWKKISPDINEFNSRISTLSQQLRIEHVLSSRLIELSNGEGKRLQLARTLLQNPEIIILDNPFIGLDVESRKVLHSIINKLIHDGILIILITTKDEVPDAISRVIELENGSIKNEFLKHEFNADDEHSFNYEVAQSKAEQLKDLLINEEDNFKVAIEMKHVNVSYGDKQILQDINWKVAKGECWALFGENGAGKSTLLSLINGDNPQAYSNEIYLFDKKKGTGESIWDLKRKIGYISPELHIFYHRNPSFTESLTINDQQHQNADYAPKGTSVFETIASGFNDQVGSSQKISSFQNRQVKLWLELLELDAFKNESLSSLSMGNQRLALLGRALVKNPPLLILDEPCQGLDNEQTHRFTSLVDLICREFNKTLIYVSHYTSELPSCVTKSLVLKKGNVVDAN